MIREKENTEKRRWREREDDKFSFGMDTFLREGGRGGRGDPMPQSRRPGAWDPGTGIPPLAGFARPDR